MIHEAVAAIAGEINRFLQSKHNITEEKVVLSNIVNIDGSVAVQEPDKIVLTLTNIEMDKSQSSVGSYKQSSSGGFSKVKAPVNTNITLLFSAYFTTENYLEGLKFIASVVAFFSISCRGVHPSEYAGIKWCCRETTSRVNFTRHARIK